MNLEEKQVLAEACAAEFKDAWKTPEGREALAQKITKYIRLDVEQQDLSGLLLDKEYLTLGQKPEYTLLSKLKAYWHEPGSYAPRTGMTQKVFHVPTGMISCHPEYELGTLKVGRYGTIADQIAAATEEILGQLNALTFNLILNAIGVGGGNFAALATNIVTQAALDAAINWVEDQQGGARAIVGRRSILNPISTFSYNSPGIYSDRQLDEIMRTGVVSIYRGLPVIGLPQYHDGHGMQTIPSNTILVVGKNMGKFVVEEDVQQMQDTDINDLMWHMHVWTRVGAAVFFPCHGYRLDLHGTQTIPASPL